MRRKAVSRSRVLPVGLAYKPNVDDMRESPTFILMDLLKGHGAEVAYHDPHVPEIGPTREDADWQGVRSIKWDEQTSGGFDAAIVVTAHKAVDHAQLAAWCPVVIDTRNVLAAAAPSPVSAFGRHSWTFSVCDGID